MQMQENTSQEEKLRLEIAERLDHLILTYYNGRNVELSRATDGIVPESAISRWRTGKSLPETKSLIPLEEKAGISLDWLMKGEGEIRARGEAGLNFMVRRSIANAARKSSRPIMDALLKQAQPLQQPEKTNVGDTSNFKNLKKQRIRVYLTPANAGRGFTLDDMPDAEDYRPLFANNDDIIVVPVSGTSMEPDILDGSKVYVDTSRKEPRNGEIVLCNVDGVNYVKWYFKTNEKIWLASSNDKYDPFRINGFNNSMVYGVVIEISRTPARGALNDFSFPNEENLFEEF
jgi:phage repressor protein C with HTH and peptisase S24 domain